MRVVDGGDAAIHHLKPPAFKYLHPQRTDLARSARSQYNLSLVRTLVHPPGSLPPCTKVLLPDNLKPEFTFQTWRVLDGYQYFPTF
jgi:hypothetical protein